MKSEEIIKLKSNLPEDFDIPADVSPVDALHCLLTRMEGVLSLLGKVPNEDSDAIWAVTGMTRQCQKLVERWDELMWKKG